MINRVLDLQTLTVRQVMKPLEQAVAMTAQTPVSAALALCRERKLTRLPVWESRDGGQRIIGMLALNTLLYQPALDPAKPVGEYVKPALFLEEDLRLEVALRRLQRSGAAAGDCAGPRPARDRHSQLAGRAEGDLWGGEPVTEPCDSAEDIGMQRFWLKILLVLGLVDTERLFRGGGVCAGEESGRRNWTRW